MIETVDMSVWVVQMKAFHMSLEEKPPDLVLVLDEVALGDIIITLALLGCETKIDESHGVETEMLGDDMTSQRTDVVDLRIICLDLSHHVKHMWQVILRR